MSAPKAKPATPREKMKVKLVVAVCKATRGIGVSGALPWRLRGDMAFFKQLTRSTTNPLKRNAVIMGRKTWQSIPEKFRPLADRLNVVVSSNAAARKEYAIPADVLVASSLPEALALLAEDGVGRDVESVFVIGGASLYREALATPGLCERVHITNVCRLKGDGPEAVEDAAGFACAGFFPELLAADFRLASQTAEQTEGTLWGTLRFSFATYAAASAASAVPSAHLAALGSVHEELQYLNLVRDVIETGVRREDRTGVGTLSKFGVQMRFSLRERFPLLTTKSVFWRGVAEELLWFVSGDTSAKTLQDKKIRIWDGNSSREYLDSIGLADREEGDLGPVYGWQWRHFGAEYVDMHADYAGQGVDQIAAILHALKHKPHDRRIVLSAWNPADLPKMALPPCHMFAQFFVADGELSCQMYQRSADLGLGVPFNIASYALLTRLLAHVSGLKAGDFVHCIGDAHVYLNHVEALREQLMRTPRPFPTLSIADRVTSLDECTFADFTIDGYEPHGKIKMEMAV